MTISRPTATMNAIADALGISVATVSNALSGKGRVSAELAARVRAKAGELGFVPSRAARALRTGRTGVIGLVLPDISNPFFPQLAQAMEHAATSAGYGVLIADSGDQISRQTDAIGRLIERGVDGIIIIPRRGSRIADVAAPVAIVDSPSTPGNTVSSDHWDGGVQMGRYLASLGHRKVLLIGYSQSSNVQNDRIGGLMEGLGSLVSCETLWIDSAKTEDGSGGSLGLAGRIRDGFSAFAAVTDLLALRVLTELQREGIDIPRQASVSGFDDLVWASAVSPALTTLRQDLAVIAERAVQALNRAIDDKSDTRPSDGTAMLEQAGERVPMQLVVRHSTGPASMPAIAVMED